MPEQRTNFGAYVLLIMSRDSCTLIGQELLFHGLFSFTIVCICRLSVGIGLQVHVNVTSKHVNLLGFVRLRGENFRWAALVQGI